MKKIFIMSFFALLFMQACKKDQELIDNKKPEERVAEALDKYKSELIGSTNGWVATIKTSEIEGSYSFYMNFSDVSRVTMLADYDATYAITTGESTYRLKYVMAPSIIFDTYSLLALLQDPNPSSFRGDYGIGYGSDFEFEIRAQAGDTLKLLGKKRLTGMTLVKATAAEAAFYKSGALATQITGINKYLIDNPYLYVLDPKDNVSKVQVAIGTGLQTRLLSLTSVLSPDVSPQSTLAFSFTGLSLANPVVFNGVTYTSVVWDATAKKLYLITSTGSKTEVLVSPSPIMPLYILLGSNYKSITIPNATTYPGWGTDFISRRALANQKTSANIVVGTTPVTLGTMKFTFNSTLKSMILVWNTPYGTSSLNLTYPFTYEKDASGIYKFTIGSGFDANSNFIYTQASKPLAPILDERINVDHFKMDYFVHPTTGATLGQFKSIENPDFTFTGALQ